MEEELASTWIPPHALRKKQMAPRPRHASTALGLAPCTLRFGLPNIQTPMDGGLIKETDMSKIILSLCDYTGNWTQPYKDLGYTVILVDPKHSAHNTTDNPVLYPCTVQHFLFHVMDTLKPRVHGILMAPPCTHFTVSGARWWKGKDKDGRTEEG